MAWIRNTVAKILAVMVIMNLEAQASPPNIIVVLVDDVGTGWIPPYAERLTPSDIEPEITDVYVANRTGWLPPGKERPMPMDAPERMLEFAVDRQKHLQAAQSCMPTLAKMARDGAVFKNCFATAALCAPSRAGVLTGTFPQRWGAYWNMDIDHYGVPLDRTVIAEPLSKSGYRCGMIGKWHIAKKDPALLEQAWLQLGGSGEIPAARRDEVKLYAAEELAYYTSSDPAQHPLSRGFDYYFGYNCHEDRFYNSSTLWENFARVPVRPEGEFLTDLFNEKARGFVEESLAQKTPFFLYYSPMSMHGPLPPPPDRYSRQFATGIPFSNAYAGHLLALDHGLEMMTDALKHAGQLENTLFIFTADNGGTVFHVPPHNAPNRGGKGTAWLGGFNVPFIVYQPGTVKPGFYQDIVSLADLLPTVVDAAGATVPAGIDGRSLLPFLRGEKMVGPRDSLVSCGIHSSHWSYFYEGDGDINDRDGRQSPMYAWVLEEDALFLQITPLNSGIMDSLPDGLPARNMLFDLSADRQQRWNLYDQSPERAAALQKQIPQWLSGMKEPLTSQKKEYRVLRNEL